MSRQHKCENFSCLVKATVFSPVDVIFENHYQSSIQSFFSPSKFFMSVVGHFFQLLVLEKKMTKYNTAQKMKFFIKDFFSKCDQIRSFMRIWSNLLKKSFMKNLIFCSVPEVCNLRINQHLLW